MSIYGRIDLRMCHLFSGSWRHQLSLGRIPLLMRSGQCQSSTRYASGSGWYSRRMWLLLPQSRRSRHSGSYRFPDCPSVGTAPAPTDHPFQQSGQGSFSGQVPKSRRARWKRPGLSILCPCRRAERAAKMTSPCSRPMAERVISEPSPDASGTAPKSFHCICPLPLTRLSNPLTGMPHSFIVARQRNSPSHRLTCSPVNGRQPLMRKSPCIFKRTADASGVPGAIACSR